MDDEDGNIVVDDGDQITKVESNSGILSFVVNNIDSGLTFIQFYGWFIVIGAIALYYLYNRYKTKFPKNLKKPSSMNSKNEEQSLEQMRRIEEVRRKQQEAFDAAARRHLEEKKKKEEKEAQEKAEEWERHKQGLGYKSKIKKPDESEDLAKLGLASSSLNKTKTKRLRDSDYNPLIGSSSNSGGSCSFRPGRKSGPRGG